MTAVLVKRRYLDPETDSHRGRAMWRATGSMLQEDWNDAATSQQKSAGARSWKEPERILPLGFRGNTALLAPGFWTSASRAVR